jgi:glutaredoxin
MSPSTVVLYVRQGCHLCEDAYALLTRHGLHPLVIDIDVDQTKKEAYDECVPVVEIDGRARFRGRVNEPLLRRIVRRYKWM